jgi:hypothetical protein
MAHRRLAYDQNLVGSMDSIQSNMHGPDACSGVAPGSECM